jgi:hypothetical protein
MVNNRVSPKQVMSLDSIALPGFEDSRGVRFWTMNGNVSEREFVTRAALQSEGAPLSRDVAFRSVQITRMDGPVGSVRQSLLPFRHSNIGCQTPRAVEGRARYSGGGGAP